MAPRTTSSSRRELARGFTLVELLVVIGIIVVLISILMPMVNKAYRQAVRTRMTADLAAIGQALDVYRNEWGDYPRPNANTSGAVVLCWALIAPGPQSQDGYGADANGKDLPTPGFRLRGTQGTVHGPYLNPTQFKLGEIAGKTVTPNPTVPNDFRDVILDRYNNPILYFPAYPHADPTKAYVGTWGYTPPAGKAVPQYNVSDNSAFIDAKHMQAMLGDIKMKGTLDSTEQGYSQPYLLWSAGPDGVFGPDLTSGPDVQQAVNRCDDVTNFR